MALLKLLVKDYGHEGMAVFGITSNIKVAQAWEASDLMC